MITLYRLEKWSGIHRDTFEHIATRKRIPLLRLRASTPRYRVRAVTEQDAARLLALVMALPRCGKRRGIMCSSSTGAPV